jgi:nitrite reductase (cytochrome c-552)
MGVRVTRPGFVNGIAALARSEDPVPHLPSIERWRDGPQEIDYDPNTMATRQEMRSFFCAQCHVEYYCAAKETLFFPWERGLKVEQIEATYDNHEFPDGSPFLLRSASYAGRVRFGRTWRNARNHRTRPVPP